MPVLHSLGKWCLTIDMEHVIKGKDKESFRKARKDVAEITLKKEKMYVKIKYQNKTVL